MIELLAVSVNVSGVIGRVHQFIEVNDSLRGQRHERDGYLRVVHAGAGQQRADGQLSVRNVEMKFVPAPVLLVSLAVRLGPHIALPR